MKKDRGILLTVFLVFQVFSLLYAVPQLINPTECTAYYGPNHNCQLSYLAGFVVGIPTIIGLLKWKKWGVFLYFIYIVIALYTGFAGIPEQYRMFNYIYTLPLVSIFVLILPLWIIKRKWKYFS